MTYRATLSAEHAELEILADQLVETLTSDADYDAIEPIRTRLTEVLLRHLATEDGLLYPALITSPSAQVRWIATRFSAEMGDLARAYCSYAKRWTPATIAADRKGFHAETLGVIAALRKRIAREEAELYPALDLIAHAQVAPPRSRG